MVMFLIPFVMEMIPANNSSSTQRILRTVPDDKAFYFYLGIDRPMNVRANNLNEFLEKLRSVEIDSIEFHLARGDFGRWIDMLGDHTLVQSIGELRGRNLHSSQLRQRLIEITTARINRLEKIEN